MLISNGSLVTKTPLSLTVGSSFFPSMPPMSTHHWPSAYGSIYRTQLWAYVVIGKRARAVARLPLPVYERNGTDRVRTDAHPMARLLANPNPAMSVFDLWEWTVATRDIHGEAFWYKLRDNNGTVVGLYPFHPTAMRELPGGKWSFDNGSLRLDEIDAVDLVPFKTFNPDSLTRGMSPLEPLRATLENEWHARTATSSFWKRGARPGMALSHPGALSEPAQQRLKAQMDSVAAGSDKTGVTIVLEEGMKPEPMTLTAEEAQYIETRKLNREEVCAAYDVPPPVVHILDHATFSNITEQMRSMYRDTMAPVLGSLESSIELHLRQAEWPNDDVYAEFLMEEVLRGDFETRQDALAKAEHMTIAEKRKVENLPFIDGTDRIFMNAANVPMPMPSLTEGAEEKPYQDVGLPALIAAGIISDQDARDLLRIPGAAPGPPAVPLGLEPATVRSVMGRLSWQQGLDDVDAKSLVAGLGGATRAVLVAFDRELAAGGNVKGLRERIRAMTKED